MAFKTPTLAYTGAIRSLALEKNGAAVTVGGETAFPFYTFEGTIPHLPKIAIQVPDFPPDDWPEACLEPYQDVLHDPIAWAKKAQDVYKADIILLWLKSTDPNGLNRSAEDAAQIVKKVLDAISIPLIVWGSGSVEKDAEVLRQVAIACADHKVTLGPVQEGNHKQIGAQALAYNHRVVASSPIDINIAKQLNILLGNLGVAPENIIIDPTTGAIGYGIEYTYSVMERIRQAALTQQDEKLQHPMLCNLAEEVWKTKEARLADDPSMGKGVSRGILLEAMTAVTLLLAGADILVMRHPRSIQLVRSYSEDMAGVIPAQEAPLASEGVKTGKEPKAAMIANLPHGMTIDIDVAKIVDAPIMVGPDHLLAVIKVGEGSEGGITISPAALEVFSAFLEAKKGDTKAKEIAGESSALEKPKKKKIVPQAKVLSTWSAPQDTVGEFKYPTEKKKDFSGKEVELLGPSYEKGTPSEKEDWRQKMKDREDMILYLKTGLRYWYSTDWYGSEKRKTKA